MKKIKIKKNTKVYILAPTNAATGGPECLHQLAFNLKKIFRINNIFMVYLPLSDIYPVHKNYKNYNIQFTKKIEDTEQNILISPEHTLFLNYSLQFKKIRKAIWWLSVDNYLGFKFKFENHKYIRSIIKFPFNIISIFNKLTNYFFGILTLQEYLKFYYKFFKIDKQKEIKQASFHFTQSYYAYIFLKEKLRNIWILYDHQNEGILRDSKKLGQKKQNLICYSHKSNDFINLLKSSVDNKFIKLQNFNSNQIINIFRKTKIYIDFGFHPGKDKMPREAALFNNCIITNRKGSAENDFDIPISKKYKFDEKYSNLPKIKKLINKIFLNHNSELKNFKKYRLNIKNEKNIFIKHIKRIFIKI